MTHTSTEQSEALQLAHALNGSKLIDDSTEWADTLHAAAAELRRLHSCVIDLESEAQANARIIGASAENELALRARVQELQRRVAKLENELSARDTGSLKPVAWMHEDTFYSMRNTARSEKTRWLVHNLSEHHSTSGMIPLYVAPVQEKCEVLNARMAD